MVRRPGLAETVERLSGTWGGSGRWTTPDGKSRAFLDHREIGPGAGAALTLRTNLSWPEGEDAPFYEELAALSTLPSDDALRLQLMSPQGRARVLTGRLERESGDGIRLAFAGASRTRDADPLETLGEQIEVTLTLRDGELVWTFTSTADFYGLADHTHRLVSVLRRGDPEA
ncbi:MAG: heme-binding beta-barrel domain-containing protein [Myxococcota bacterium]